MNYAGFDLRRINKSYINTNDPMTQLLWGLKSRGLLCTWIMDVGANQAYWSKTAASVFNESKFCLVEPQKEMEGYLSSFCTIHEGSFFVLAAAGSTKENKPLTIWDDLQGSSFLPDANETLIASGEQRIVPVTTIDGILIQHNIPAPGIIKLDIQGFELEALKGATSTFGITEAYILEVSLFPFMKGMPVFADVINFMLERDYVVYDFPGFLKRPYDGALGQCDICFVRRNGFLRASSVWQ